MYHARGSKVASQQHYTDIVVVACILFIWMKTQNAFHIHSDWLYPNVDFCNTLFLLLHFTHYLPCNFYETFFPLYLCNVISLCVFYMLSPCYFFDILFVVFVTHYPPCYLFYIFLLFFHWKLYWHTVLSSHTWCLSYDVYSPTLAYCFPLQSFSVQSNSLIYLLSSLSPLYCSIQQPCLSSIVSISTVLFNPTTLSIICRLYLHRTVQSNSFIYRLYLHHTVQSNSLIYLLSSLSPPYCSIQQPYLLSLSPPYCSIQQRFLSSIISISTVLFNWTA